MVVALPSNHMVAQSTAPDSVVMLNTLAPENFIVYRRPAGPGLYDEIIAACHMEGFSPRIGQEAPRIVSTLNLVAAGLGIAIVPDSLRRMRMDGVTYRHLECAFPPRAQLNLAMRRGEWSETVKRFSELITRTAKLSDA